MKNDKKKTFLNSIKKVVFIYFALLYNENHQIYYIIYRIEKVTILSV